MGSVVRGDGAPRFVEACKGVVLATGGSVMNEEMRRKHCSQTFLISDPIGEKDDGNGIALGVSARGKAVHMDQVFTTRPWTMPAPQAHGVFVNVHGQRFINENCYHGRGSCFCVDLPGGRVFLLLDSAHFSQPAKFARTAFAATGETEEEVEEELEMPAGTLSATMDFYHRHAAERRDPLFDKQEPMLVALDKAPFVALELNFETSYFSLLTLGGFDTTVDGEVLDRAGKPTCQPVRDGALHPRLPVSGHGYFSGLSLADCTFFGRRVGRAAARD